MKISSCGTQEGMTNFQKRELPLRLLELSCSELVNGGCIGSDEEAILLAYDSGTRIFHVYPSYIKAKQSVFAKLPFTGNDYRQYDTGLRTEFRIKIEKEQAPLERNKKIVDESDVLIATPKEHSHTLRSGTWSTIRYAWKRKKKVIIIPPIILEEDGNKE